MVVARAWGWWGKWGEVGEGVETPGMRGAHSEALMYSVMTVADDILLYTQYLLRGEILSILTKKTKKTKNKNKTKNNVR